MVARRERMVVESITRVEGADIFGGWNDEFWVRVGELVGGWSVVWGQDEAVGGITLLGRGASRIS